MNPGRLDEKLTFQQERSTDEGGGVKSTAFEDVAEVWGAVEELDGRERSYAARAGSTETHRLTVRRPITTEAGMKIVPTAADRFQGPGGTVFRVAYVRGRRCDRYYEIMCAEKSQ